MKKIILLLILTLILWSTAHSASAMYYVPCASVDDTASVSATTDTIDLSTPGLESLRSRGYLGVLNSLFISDSLTVPSTFSGSSQNDLVNILQDAKTRSSLPKSQQKIIDQANNLVDRLEKYNIRKQQDVDQLNRNLLNFYQSSNPDPLRLNSINRAYDNARRSEEASLRNSLKGYDLQKVLPLLGY